MSVRKGPSYIAGGCFGCLCISLSFFFLINYGWYGVLPAIIAEFCYIAVVAIVKGAEQDTEQSGKPFLSWLWPSHTKYDFEAPNIDVMSGTEFEQYLQQLLIGRGYCVTITKSTGDLGVDLVATRGDDRVAIQVKRQKENVSRRAVSDAVAGKYHYECTKAMVITNSYFTAGAKILAISTRCVLVDRDKLYAWIREAN